MTEVENFEHFKQYQLVKVDFELGQLDVKRPVTHSKLTRESSTKTYILYNIGSKNHDGYIRVWCGDRDKGTAKLRMRHRLIYWLYHGEIPEGMEIDHINGVRGDDRICNLMAVTKKQNMQKALVCPSKKYTKEDILEVCHLLQETSLSDVLIAEKTGLSRNYVRDIKKRRRRTEISSGFNWEHREK